MVVASVMTAGPCSAAVRARRAGGRRRRARRRRRGRARCGCRRADAPSACGAEEHVAAGHRGEHAGEVLGAGFGGASGRSRRRRTRRRPSAANSAPGVVDGERVLLVVVDLGRTPCAAPTYWHTSGGAAHPLAGLGGEGATVASSSRSSGMMLCCGARVQLADGQHDRVEDVEAAGHHVWSAVTISRRRGDRGPGRGAAPSRGRPRPHGDDSSSLAASSVPGGGEPPDAKHRT